MWRFQGERRSECVKNFIRVFSKGGKISPREASNLREPRAGGSIQIDSEQKEQVEFARKCRVREAILNKDTIWGSGMNVGVELD